MPSDQELQSILDTARALSDAALVVSREARGLRSRMYVVGVRFPNLFDHVISELDMTINTLGTLLKPENLQWWQKL